MNKEKCMAACNAVLDLLEKDFNIGVGWLEMLNVIAEGCVTVPEPQKFDPEAKVKVLGEMYSGVNPTIQAPQPWQPPTKPYIGDPPGWYPGNGTVCGTSKSQSVNDATGVSNEGTEEPL